MDIDEEEAGEELRFIISRNKTPACVLLEQPQVSQCLEGRDSLEISPAAWNILGHLQARIVEDGGAGLIADYGHLGGGGDTGDISL